MNPEYEQKGYFIVRSLYKKNELQELREVLLKFHELWKHKNAELYAKRAINSAYLTSTEYLDSAKREVLFKFIGSTRIMDVVYSIIPENPVFVNTQLFFNPVNKDQKNYWHRDPQYHLSLEEQKEALNGPNALHFRLALEDEPGVELIPGTHKNWDTKEELDIRLEQSDRKSHEDIRTGVKIELATGDLLVFSANMIHRGLYGMDRFAFDLLFGDPAPELMEFVQDDCLPNQEIINKLEDPTAFLTTIKLRNTFKGRKQ